jgi:protein-disulfide isomerase
MGMTPTNLSRICAWLLALSAATAWAGPGRAAGAVKDSEAFPQATADLPIAPSDPQLGKREAPLTLVVLFDYEDPFSRHYFAHGVAELRAHYGANLRVVFKDFPLAFHKNAINIASSVHGVYELGGVSAFEKFVALIGEHQGELDQATMTGLALIAGVKNRAAFEEGLLTQRWLREVQASQRAIASLDSQGTPTSYVNGLKFVGALSGKSLEAKWPAIDEELAATKAELKQGFKPLDLYGYRVKKNIDHDLVLQAQREAAPGGPEREPKLVPEERVGPVRLGMSLTDLGQVPGLRLKLWSGERACATTSTRSDECAYTLYMKSGVVERIYYYVASRGLSFEGKTLEPSASLPETLRILHCGQYEVGEGGGSASCPHHVEVTQGGIICHKTLADDAETPCHTPPNGRVEAPGLVEIRISR